MFEGRGPLMILLLVLIGGLALNLTPCVLPMIPINLAIIGAGAQAGSVAEPRLPARLRLRRRDGAGLRRPRPGRHPDGRHVRHDQLVAVVQPGHRDPLRRARPGDVRRRHHRLLAILEPVPGGRNDRGRFGLAFTHGRRRRAARRRVRGAGRHPGGAVLEQPLRDRHEARARAAVLPRRRHGDPVADCRRGPRRAAEARDVDGARQAGVRRLHPRDGGVLRLRGVLDLREPLGRPVRRRVERRRRS